MKAVVRTRNELLRWVDQVAPEVEASQKPWTVTIKRFHRIRTLDQNGKFHAMCGELAAHVGHSPAEVKDYIKAECGWTKTIQIGSEIRDVPMGTSEMNVEQLSHLIEELYRIGAEVGCRYVEE